MNPQLESLCEKVEGRWGMKLPGAYVDMMRRGWLEWSEVKRQNADNYKPNSPTFYLWFSEMEWLPLDKMATFTFPIPVVDRFLPFAKDGGGACWSWDVKREGKDGAPVVFLPNDCEVAHVYAHNFVDALYRHVLDFARCCYAEQESRAWLTLWCECFTPYFPGAWIERIVKIRKAPYLAGKTAGYPPDFGSLLSVRDHRAFLMNDLNLPAKDIEFNWV